MSDQHDCVWREFKRSVALGWAATQFAVLVGLFSDKVLLQTAPWAVAGILFSLPLFILCSMYYGVFAHAGSLANRPNAILDIGFAVAAIVSCFSLVHLLSIFSLIFAIAFVAGVVASTLLSTCVMWSRKRMQ